MKGLCLNPPKERKDSVKRQTENVILKLLVLGNMCVKCSIFF